MVVFDEMQQKQTLLSQWQTSRHSIVYDKATKRNSFVRKLESTTIDPVFVEFIKRKDVT